MIKLKRGIVKTVLKECLGYKNGETLLIVTDDKLEHLAEIFYIGAQRLEIEVSLIKMTPQNMHGEEPPKAIAQALKSVDLALLITDKSLSHTKARKVASHKFGTRIASMPGLTRYMLNRCVLIDYQNLKKKVSQFACQLTKAKSIKVTTKAGTNLTFSVKGRMGFEDHGLYVSRGTFGNLPAGEACIAPIEGTTNGRLIIDASMASLGRVKKPIEVIIEKGFVKKISYKRLASLLKPLGKNALNIAEFGIGLNPKAKVTGNVLEDEKAPATAHIAFGDNRSFGGKITAPCHLDGVFFNPRIEIKS
jgi:leucyl aminopeptidase (aminopeptidase T)